MLKTGTITRRVKEALCFKIYYLTVISSDICTTPCGIKWMLLSLSGVLYVEEMRVSKILSKVVLAGWHLIS